jgi:hypothetical protein
MAHMSDQETILHLERRIENMEKHIEAQDAEVFR